MKNLAAIIFSVLLAQSVGVLGSVFMGDALSTWYLNLAVPSWNPPPYVFGPVWTVLYTLMGVAVYLVWGMNRAQPYRRRALTWYGIQLALNGLWTPLFFGLHSPLLALIDIILLVVAIVTTMFYFHRVHKISALLLLPYLTWVVFASVLNFTIVILNT